MTTRIYVSKSCNIDPRNVRTMDGSIVYELRHSLQHAGSLLFIDPSPGAPWPHACAYIAVEDRQGRICTDTRSEWPPDAKIEFDDPNGYLADARAAAEQVLVKVRSCGKKHKGPIRDTGRTRRIEPGYHSCSDLSDYCSKCEPQFVKVEICDACGQEV
jgi:hypothetical protein